MLKTRFYETRILLERFKKNIIFMNLDSENMYIDIDTVISLAQTHTWSGFNWIDFSHSVHISFEDIRKHKDLNWNWLCVSHSPNVCLQDVLDHPNLPWDWRGVSHNPNITLQDVLKHPDLPWSWRDISQNPNTTKDVIRKHPDMSWDLDYVDDEYIFIGDMYTFSIAKGTWHTQKLIHHVEPKGSYSEWPSQGIWFLSEKIVKRSRKLKNIEDVYTLPLDKWCFKTLVDNNSILLRDILNHPKLPWDWTCVVCRKTDYILLHKAIVTLQRRWRKNKL